MTMLQNLNRQFGARKDVLGANKGAMSAEKLSSHPFSPQTLPSTVHETGARKSAASADKASFGANKVLALKF